MLVAYYFAWHIVWRAGLGLTRRSSSRWKWMRTFLSPGCQAVRCCQVICRAVGHCQALSGASVRPAVRCCQCCQVLSGACLTGEVICSCRVLSELSGVAVRRCRSCQSCQAAAAVRRRAGAVRCCQVVLSGCCQALTHTSHTYDTIKRRPAGLYYTYSSLYSASGPTIFFMVDVTIFSSAALRE